MAHITILDLLTVRLSLEEFIEYFSIRQSDVVRLFTENMVVARIVSAMCSKSPMLMAELRRLHDILREYNIQIQIQHLPSALNLFADRLSRRSRYHDYLPRLTAVPEHWWVGDSEHDLNASW